MFDRITLESRKLYSVAWITALPSELAAAIAMLDERHNEPADFAVHHHVDSNSYSWGRIGKHNVVITSLPDGVYGTTSATGTAMSLVSSLPHIRIGLLVGIGGGHPTSNKANGHDIRLGDIAVNQPTGTHGGIIQYDLVKATSSGRERKGFLTGTPDVLRKAVAALKADHRMQDSQVPQILSEAMRKYPKMLKAKPGCKYQGSVNDRLFESTYEHIYGADCNNCAPEKEIRRDERDSSDPEIHYGIILSGNTLVKDGVQRDKIIKDVGEKEEDCICFEMEAAGLMNSFPCLVIRGICDYADTHKDDRWQDYAAVTAAAYAKELLGYVSSAELISAQKIGDILKDGQSS
jgi:nucleoside phosphorylase